MIENYLLNNDLFDNNYLPSKMIRIKNDLEGLHIFEDEKNIMFIKFMYFTKKEKKYLQSSVGIAQVIFLYKEGFNTIEKIKQKIKFICNNDK